MLILYVILLCLLRGVAGDKKESVVDPHFKCGVSQQTEKKWMIVGEHTSGGAGNFLIFYPAAYAFAKASGRQIVLQDGTHPYNACELQGNCKLPSVNTLKAKDKDFAEGMAKASEGVKAWDMFRFARGDHVGKVVAHARGYQEKSGWFLGNATLKACIAKETKCKIGDLTCVVQRAYSELFPGPFKKKYFDPDTLGGDDKIIEASFGKTVEHVPRYDMAIHLRVQFSHFENHTDPNNKHFLKFERDYLAKKTTKTLFDNIVRRTEQTLMPNGHTKHSGEDHAYSIYIASDSESVKRALSDVLESSGFLVTSTHSSGIVHSNAIKPHTIGHFYTFYDWASVANAKNLLAWRSVAPSRCLVLLSTFAQSAHRYRRPAAFVLADSTKLDASDGNWRKFFG